MTSTLRVPRQAPPAGTEVALVFPGQGSQYPGMLRDLQRCGPPARDLLAAAQEVTGLPVEELMSTGAPDVIADPHVAQVLVFVSATALLDELRGCGWAPAAVAGHSLGEYAALVAAGMLDWEEALRLVDFRGRAMAEAARARPGAMAAIVGLPGETVRELCRSACRGRELAVVANLNSSRQLVVSGTAAAVEDVAERARRAGALRARRLPVGGAYHSALMFPAADRMATRLRAAPLRPPAVPFVSSVTGALVTDVERYRQALLGQVTGPVRWQDAIGTLAGLGLCHFVEVGPGKVLTGLGRENVRDGHHHLVHELLAVPAGAGRA